MSRVVVAGGTGFIGQPLVRELAAAGHEVQVLARSPERAEPALPKGARAVRWDPRTPDHVWTEALDGADVVVNLAGESIASGRWTDERKATLVASRLDSTNALVSTIGQLPEGRRPRALVSASASGYYGDRGEEALTEASPPGSDFLAHLCVEWEAAARKAEAFGVRVAIVRTGIVLARHGGALKEMLRPFKLFVGGPLGSGRQWMSWIHLADEVELFKHAVEHETVRGPLNGTAPNPVRMKAFAETLGHTIGRPSVVPAPGFALRIALGEMAEPLLLASQQIRPEATLASGYRFKFTQLETAMKDALSR